MDCRALLPEQLPHTTKLTRDYTANFSKLENFFAHPPELKSIGAVAEKLRFPAERRGEVTEILRTQNKQFGSSPKTQENIDLLERSAVTIVTGQQVGLFGGPAYAFYKAFSAIHTARQLTKDGIEAVPVFWMATEDHDVDEVRHTTWFSDGKLHRFELPAPNSGDSQRSLHEAGVPVGRILLGTEISAIVNQATAMLTGPDSARVTEILQHAYTPEATYGSAFAQLFGRIFAEEGLILLDPLDERLHRVAAPILRQALEQRDELNLLLLRRGKDLERSGYAAQVNVTARSTVLFSMAGGKRHVISTANGDGLTSGRHTAPRDEWLQNVENHPELFSPNALFRPVVQDYMLPTVAYFGGPAEVAYYAQSQVLYETLLGRMPVILPRADFTLVDPKAVRLLRKYGLQVEDVWQGRQILRRRMFGTSVPKKLAREFDENLRQMEKSSKKLRKELTKVDPTLQDTVTRAEKRISYQIGKLRERTGAALDRHEKLIDQHEQFLENLLYPEKDLQSRDLNFLPFLSRWGAQGLKDLEKHASPKKPGRHFVVPIP
jgi:bacillithiol biosynthesis cysteine-adding enzyme BshC